MSTIVHRKLAWMVNEKLDKSLREEPRIGPFEMRSSLSGIGYYNLQELLRDSNICTLKSFVTLGIRSEGNAPKMENQQVVSPSWQCSSTPVRFGQGFPSKEQCDNTGASPTPGSSWVLSVSLTEIRIEGATLLCCYWLHKECDERAE
jgi:hypothetical protein